MALCKGCGAVFQWGFCDGRWVPLEPIDTHDDLDKSYVDENGVGRADHRDRHDSEQLASVNVTRLDRKIPAAIEPEEDDEDYDVGAAQDALSNEHLVEHDGVTGFFAALRGHR